jgi:hypothetical protein
VRTEEWLIHNQLLDAIQLQALQSAVARVAIIDEQPLSRKTTVASERYSPSKFFATHDVWKMPSLDLLRVLNEIKTRSSIQELPKNSV